MKKCPPLPSTNKLAMRDSQSLQMQEDKILTNLYNFLLQLIDQKNENNFNLLIKMRGKA